MVQSVQILVSDPLLNNEHCEKADDTILIKSNRRGQKTNIIKNKKEITAREVGPTCDAKYCLSGPAERDSILGVICQNPTGGSAHIHPCTLISWLLHEYRYLSSTCN